MNVSLFLWLVEWLLSFSLWNHLLMKFVHSIWDFESWFLIFVSAQFTNWFVLKSLLHFSFSARLLFSYFLFLNLMVLRFHFSNSKCLLISILCFLVRIDFTSKSHLLNSFSIFLTYSLFLNWISNAFWCVLIQNWWSLLTEIDQWFTWMCNIWFERMFIFNFMSTFSFVAWVWRSNTTLICPLWLECTLFQLFFFFNSLSFSNDFVLFIFRSMKPLH